MEGRIESSATSCILRGSVRHHAHTALQQHSAPWSYLDMNQSVFMYSFSSTVQGGLGSAISYLQLSVLTTELDLPHFHPSSSCIVKVALLIGFSTFTSIWCESKQLFLVPASGARMDGCQALLPLSVLTRWRHPTVSETSQAAMTNALVLPPWCGD